MENKRMAVAKKENTEKKPVAKKCAAKKSSPRAGQPRGHRVSITYLNEPGKQVFIAGSFNDWNPTARQLTDANGTGKYFTRFLLKKGVYQYKLIVDGQWILDPENPLTVANDLGGLNNLLDIASDEE